MPTPLDIVLAVVALALIAAVVLALSPIPGQPRKPRR